MEREHAVYSVVVPMFNEELVIYETYKRLKKIMDTVQEEYEIIFVDDGSKDNTTEIVKSICKKDNHAKLIVLSRNFGHQIAITAGMDYARGKAIIVIDADLQDPPEVIPEMIKKWKEGYHVVYGKRLKRKEESIFKKATAKVFYRFLKILSEVEIPVDTGDFRLIDRKVCDALRSIPEHNRYVRGLISWLGFKQIGVEYVRDGRFAGKTKYTLKKMIKLASDGITSFSNKPLKISTFIGIFLSLFSTSLILTLIFISIFSNVVIPIWLSMLSGVLLINGLLFIMVGILGAYIGRIYDEVKSRPLYIINEKEGFNAKNNKYFKAS